MRVLVAEDDENLGAVLACGLREQGYVVDLVPDGDTAAGCLRPRLADSLHGSGVRVLLVRPGFVTGRMTSGLPPAPLPPAPLPPAPLATTPQKVGAAAAALLLASRHSCRLTVPSHRCR